MPFRKGFAVTSRPSTAPVRPSLCNSMSASPYNSLKGESNAKNQIN
jgi:hypothetical protein